MAEALVTDIIILAEVAQQVAMSKEYGSGTMQSNKRCFFSKMRVKTGNPRLFECFADTCFPVVCTVHITLAGTQTAGAQPASGLLYPLPEQARAMTSHIDRFKIGHKQTPLDILSVPAFVLLT